MSPSNKNSESFFVILDAARIFGEIDTARQLQSKFLNLFTGRDEELLSSVAPYIFLFQPETDFSNWLNDKGWGNAWGIFISSNTTLEELKIHLNKFLVVRDVNGKELYLRFYDPRVLRKFLPACDATQLREFFGPVNNFLVEDEDPEFALRYRVEGNQLALDRISRLDFMKQIDLFERTVSIPRIKTDIINAEKSQIESDPKSKKGWTFMVD